MLLLSWSIHIVSSRSESSLDDSQKHDDTSPTRNHLAFRLSILCRGLGENSCKKGKENLPLPVPLRDFFCYMIFDEADTASFRSPESGSVRSRSQWTESARDTDSSETYNTNDSSEVTRIFESEESRYTILYTLKSSSQWCGGLIDKSR